jgi:hypothetical protein
VQAYETSRPATIALSLANDGHDRFRHRIALAAPTVSDAAEIKVLTTRAMNHVLTELAGEFQRTSEHKSRSISRHLPR